MLVKIMPMAMTIPSTEQLAREVKERKYAQKRLQELYTKTLVMKDITESIFTLSIICL
jgi:hypothetical protein